MSTDAIVILKDDHKRIKALFKEFSNAGENATKRRGAIVDKILGENPQALYAIKSKQAV